MTAPDDLDELRSLGPVVQAASANVSNNGAGGTKANGEVRVIKNGAIEEVELYGDHFNADRFLGEHAERVRYSPELGHWLIWNGSWWEEDRLDTVRELARETIDGLRAWVAEGSGREVVERAKHYKESTRAGRLAALLEMARIQIAVGVNELDAHPQLIACRNGTINLRTGELEPADPAHLITRGIDLDFDPEARAKPWDDFLATIFDSAEDLIGYVQRVLGYASTGEVGEHTLPNFYGAGANGKSQLIAAVQAVLGEHSAVAPDGLLVEQRHHQHPERIASLRGRRLVISSELETRDTLSEGLVKSLTGGDRLSGRHIWGHRFEFFPTHTIIIVTNKLPRVRGTDEGIWRRLAVVPFTVTIPPESRILDYGKKLAEGHGQAILAWLVNGAVAWYREGLNAPLKVQAATNNYRVHEDVFGQWLAERTTPIQGRTKQKQLRDDWKAWAEEQRINVGRDQDFSDWIEAHDYERERYSGTWSVLGLGLLAGGDGES